ncbi:hypothetical protein ABB37_00912 [Leptomonas pyrrhocoris]|uniref:Pseudouridine synthase RsuA/RluA-like domain-containing protein n=1 Tax=Leptomonas pyrrhocoris TaxID=157538 RepID=A0A0N0E0U7_LEPPY|nr:hypothetical protein ABB37_00912 [Leptomonas pyrrhocoris]KPA86865.1 hypothetical protein ABB37_00912 [Leptomonas pyrrhocoris]|eukprot:XP_015665304.1 hypothetical protein ABB37_00912 [Leptomonas pyrrhocoris]
MSVHSVQELQALEEAAWASPHRRELYSTRHVVGFPWHTVEENNDPAVSADSTSAVVRRHVIPYDYPFTVFVKGRWVGRKLLDVYAEELPHHTAAYYESCLRTGRLYCVSRAALGRHNTQRKLLKRSSAATSNASLACSTTPVEIDKQISPHRGTLNTSDLPTPSSSSSAQETPLEVLNVVLQHGDVVYHTVHRHEVPVTIGASGVDPVCITAVRIARYGLICVNKPTGLPTHATGRYMYNSLTALLEYVLAPKRLHAWLLTEDPLLQSLVCTASLSSSEKQELYAYYEGPSTTSASKKKGDVTGEAEREMSEVNPSKLPRPCHRLDKVTSGVLLLAVRQAAAKQIGTALMRKAKEVDDAVTAELMKASLRDSVEVDSSPLHRKGTSCKGDGSDITRAPALALPLSLQRILGRTYELQKHYLARVVGVLENSNEAKGKASTGSKGVPEAVWSLSGTEDCLTHHNDSVRGLLASSASSCGVVGLTAAAVVVADTELPEPYYVFPAALLTTAPIPAHHRPPAKGSNEAERDQSATNSPLEHDHDSRDDQRNVDTQRSRPSRTAELAAATLCQTLCSATPAKPATAAGNRTSPSAPPQMSSSSCTESLVLCTPYTGRLHQIRYHLSSLGCPIAGDVVYTPAAHGDVAAPTASDEVEQTPAKEVRHGWVRNERDYIYFNAAHLPVAYQRLCDSLKRPQAPQEEEEHNVATTVLGIKRARADVAGGPNPPSSLAWQQEPPCYECAGRLPIVATKECATGTSAICLHAWAYDVRESLLLLGMEKTDNETVGSDASPADVREGVSQQAGGARAMDGGFVRFEAPPPAWAVFGQHNAVKL